MCIRALILFVRRVVAHCGVTCASYGSLGRGRGLKKQQEWKVHLKALRGAFLNPGAALIIALSTADGYIKRCDLMRARPMNDVLFFFSPPYRP